MLELQKFETNAVSAAVHALVIVYARSKKGRRRLDDAITLLRQAAVASQVTPIRRGVVTPAQREALDEGALYLETVRELLDR